MKHLVLIAPVLFEGSLPPDNFSSSFEDVAMAGWTGVDGTISQETFNRPGSAGTKCLRLTDSGEILYPCAWHFNTAIRGGRWYQFDAWICKRISAAGSCGTDVRVSALDDTMLATWGGAWTVDTWKRVTTTFHVPSALSSVAPHFSFVSNAVGNYADLDDVSFSPLSLPSLISDTTTATATVTATVRITNSVDTTALGIHGQSGVICNLDSATNPMNFVLAYLDWRDDGTNYKVVIQKCVGGVYTELVDANVTYTLGGDLQLLRSGNNYSAYYNGVLVGTEAVTDASVISNTLHGTFKTHTSITLADFAVVDGQGAIKFDHHVVAEADDARWTEGNTTLTTTGQLIFGYNDGTTTRANSFMRFTGVTIPQAATISAASLSLLATETRSTTTVNLNIDAIKAVNSAAPTSYAEAESPAAGRTTAVVDWDNVAGTTDATRYSTPDFTTVIQELVDQATWASGNAMVIYIEDDGSTATNYTMRKAQGYAAGQASTARLHIEYTL